MTDGVSAVIATRGRPELLRRAVQSIFAQTTAEPIQVIVVFDRSDPAGLEELVAPAGRSLVQVRNDRSPGLAGGRNTGILRAEADTIAFCDDDDEWAPEKLVQQRALWASQPDAALVATGIEIVTNTGDRVVRLAPARAELGDLLLSRITELHPSSFLLRRADLVGPLGLVDEDLPAGYGEDYDLLLRAAKLGAVVAVEEPLTVVHWDRQSYFIDRWEGVAAGLTYLLEKHPEFATSPRGAARIEGQIAFARAALGDRRGGWRYASRAIRHDRRQLRGYLALAVAAGVPPGAIVTALNRRGRGI